MEKTYNEITEELSNPKMPQIRRGPRTKWEWIGTLFQNAYEASGGKDEFIRITFRDGDGQDCCSVIYPTLQTNLIADIDSSDVAKVICEAEEIGIPYLSARAAGRVSPQEHHRIKRRCRGEWLERMGAYLMPKSSLADITREHSSWQWLFYHEDHDGIPTESIEGAEKVIFDAFDIEDQPTENQFIYDFTNDQVFKWHHLHD